LYNLERISYPTKYSVVHAKLFEISLADTNLGANENYTNLGGIEPPYFEYLSIRPESKRISPNRE